MECFYVAGTMIKCLLGEVSTYVRLKMQCLYVAGTTSECLLRKGVHLWEVKNAMFVCIARTMTECLFRRGVHLWDFKNAVFVCGWDHN